MGEDLLNKLNDNSSWAVLEVDLREQEDKKRIS
jgi:hypothetical protein